MGGKTVNIPVQIRQSSERGLWVPRSGQMGNKCMPEGFRHSERQPRGLLWLGDGSKNPADCKQKPILTSSGFTIETLHAQIDRDTHRLFFGVLWPAAIFGSVLESFIKLQIVCFTCILQRHLQKPQKNVFSMILHQYKKINTMIVPWPVSCCDSASRRSSVTLCHILLRLYHKCLHKHWRDRKTLFFKVMCTNPSRVFITSDLTLYKTEASDSTQLSVSFPSSRNMMMHNLQQYTCR